MGLIRTERRSALRASGLAMVYQGDAINRPALLAIFREIIDHNRAGGWRKLQR